MAIASTGIASANRLEPGRDLSTARADVSWYGMKQQPLQQQL
jgi:hypothetical protein